MSTAGEDHRDDLDGRESARLLIEDERRKLGERTDSIVAAVNQKISAWEASRDPGIAARSIPHAQPRAWWRSQHVHRRIAAVVLIGVLGLAVLRDAQARQAQDSVRSLRSENAEIQRRLNQFAEEIKLLRGVITVDGLGINKTAPNRIGFAGSFDPQFIESIRYRFGTERDGKLVTLGPPDLVADADGGRVRFRKESPDLPLNNEAIVAVLEFVPRPEAAERFIEFFTPERTSYRRSFFLGRHGVETDVQPVSIAMPAEGSTVFMREELEGQVRVKGAWPVVLIKSLDNEQAWWVHDVESVSEDGRFRCLARFGENATPAGTKYSITVLLARSRDEAKAKFRPGQQFASIPAGYARSRPITVVRQ